ncbi:MAG TPA: Flp family type IVb pilin [Methylomirabilota bacterium]|nr:Flp family type IVb pilin [Methylomirabilota bacterium]
MLVSFSAITNFARRLRNDKSGVTAIEYGLIAGAISVAIIAGAYAIGGQIGPKFTCIGNSLAQSSDQCAAAPAAN